MMHHILEFSPGASGTDLLRRMTNIQLKEVKELSVAWMLGGRSRPVKGLSVLALLIITLCGCATKEASKSEPQQQNGIYEYHQITIDAIATVEVALKSLDLVSAQTNPCPARVVEAFAGDVQRLQVESLEVRAHARAIEARGDAYFDNWSENLARVNDPRVRELANRNRPQLRQSFTKIKLTSQETGAAFRSFFSGLRKLRTYLQSDQAIIDSENFKDLIHSTRTNGDQVVQLLGSIKADLETMKTLLTPAKVTSGDHV
jgi:hypothetical protein